jgi:hypothetical protein
MSKNVASILDKAVQTEAGLTVNGMALEPVVEKCEGCDRIVAHESGTRYCTTYPKPAAKWNMGVCNFATHMKATVDTQGKVKVNPLKASKRAARGR